VSESDTRGNITRYTVDGVTSRNEEVTDRLGNKTAYAYDTAGHLTRVANTGADGTARGTVDYTYDACDNLTAITRGDGMRYALGYDPFRNLTSIGVQGAEHPLAQYTYKNGSGRLKEIAYANGDKMTAVYNTQGQLAAEKWYDRNDTLTAHYKYVYDGVGNLVRAIDILASTEYTYTYEAGTLTRAAAYAVTVGENEIITARTLSHSVRYVYDGEGALVKKAFVTADGTERVVTFTNAENHTSATFAVGASEVCCQTETDHFGRKVSDALQLGDNDLTRTFAYYDGVLPQEHIDSGKEQSAPTTQLVSSITFSDGRTLSYEYDAEERITKVTDSAGGVTEYTYDALGQLLTERVNGALVNRMTYDSYGNILTKNGVRYIYGDGVWKDLLTSYDGQTITYDAGGNPVAYRGHTLAWEKGRQLKSFDNIQYTYNANGIRTSKTISGVRHDYILDGAKILRETWGENVLIPLYDSEDAVCGIVYNNTPYYFQNNLQGDIISVADATGNIVARYTYDAWGVCTITQDTTACGIAAVNPYRYRGYYYDAETGLYLTGTRYYDPEIGRFISADSVISGLENMACHNSGNLFSYCMNNAVNYKDSTGFKAVLTATMICPSNIKKSIKNSGLSGKYWATMDHYVGWCHSGQYLVFRFNEVITASWNRRTDCYVIGMRKDKWERYLQRKERLRSYFSDLLGVFGEVLSGDVGLYLTVASMVLPMLSSSFERYVKEQLGLAIRNDGKKCGSNDVAYITICAVSQDSFYRKTLPWLKKAWCPGFTYQANAYRYH